MSDQIAKWIIKLDEFDLQYRPRPLMKVQVLTDFIAECIVPNNNPNDEVDDKIKQAITPKSDLMLIWVLHIDGASNVQDSGTDLILTNFEGVITEYSLQFKFKTSNNQAKYEALLASLKIAKEFDIDSLKIFTDSQLIVGQVKDEFEAREPIMMKYLQKVKDFTSILKYFEIFISRIENIPADALS